MGTLHQEELLSEVLEDIGSKEPSGIVIFNDDFNTFEHVIKTLIKICEHTPEQAEQCSWIVHYKGQCCVKTGQMVKLKPMKEAICSAGIDARII